MTDEEESKKKEFARIQPVKIQKAMTPEEVEAHKKQLEQYYSSQKVAAIEELVSTPGAAALPKQSKFTTFFFSFFCILLFVGFCIGFFLNYFLKT